MTLVGIKIWSHSVDENQARTIMAFMAVLDFTVEVEFCDDACWSEFRVTVIIGDKRAQPCLSGEQDQTASQYN